MLRRRKKTPKPAPRVAREREPSGQSHRRARPDVPVPRELRVKPEAFVPNPSSPDDPPRRSREVVLVTGFEPFAGEKINPSWEVCKLLPAEIAGMHVETCRVPCEFRRAIEVVAGAIDRLRPTLVVCLGLAGGRTRIGVERVGINIDDARIPDNKGVQPIDEIIAANGPPAYFATLPVKAMAAAIRAAGVPVEVSNSAGTFVCNHLMYGVLHYIAASGHRARAGFIHVPWSEEQALDKRDAPSMPLASMATGVRAAIAAAQEYRHDIEAAEGTLA